MPQLTEQEMKEMVDGYQQLVATGRRTHRNKQYFIAERRRIISTMYLRGIAVHEIAERMGHSEVTVRNDLTKLRKKWEESSVESFDAQRAKELARIDQLERECWERYLISCEDTVTTKIKQDKERKVVTRDKDGNEVDEYSWDGGQINTEEGEPAYSPEDRGFTRSVEIIPTKTSEETIRKTNGSGDQRILERIQWCIETRLRLIGAFKDETQQAPTVTIQWNQMIGRDPGRVNPVENRIEEMKRKRMEEVGYTEPSVVVVEQPKEREGLPRQDNGEQ